MREHSFSHVNLDHIQVQSSPSMDLAMLISLLLPLLVATMVPVILFHPSRTLIYREFEINPANVQLLPDPSGQ